MLPAATDATLQLARRGLPKGARVAVLRDPDAEAALRGFGQFQSVAAFPAPCDAVVARRPSLTGALIPTLIQVHDALPQGARVIVSDVVWQTAPTPELARALAPAPGLEKLRPIEGYEMQLDHAGFLVLERVDVDRDAWAASQPPPIRDALHADARRAARHCAWLLERA